jgi:hypothetical protein
MPSGVDAQAQADARDRALADLLMAWYQTGYAMGRYHALMGKTQ